MAPPIVERLTPDDVMTPIGPYSHIAKTGHLISIGATAGVDPETNEIVGPSVAAQTKQILDSFERMLRTVESDLGHILHINVFLLDMEDFAEMNHAYAERMGNHRPARSAIAVNGLPKKNALVTMNLTAVTKD